MGISFLAMVSGESVVSAVLWIIILGLVFYLLWWLVGYVKLPEPFAKVANVILAVAAVVVLINCLFSLGGHALISYPAIGWH